MSNRLGLTSPSDLTADQKPLHEDILSGIRTSYDQSSASPQLTLDDDTLIGPYGVVLHHPQVGRSFIDLIRSLRALPSLSLYAREVAIAVTGSRSQAAFENYAHHIIATQRAGLTEAEMREIHAGRCPDTLTDEGKAAFELATALGKPGVLDETVYKRAVDVLGKDGAAACIHFTGIYAYVGVVLNGFDVKVPQSSSA